MIKRTVEVLAVTRGSDANTGEGVFQVTFGDVKPIPEERRREIPRQPGTELPKTLTLNVLILFISASKECPYAPGSKWKLSIDDNGVLSLSNK